jgi:hypothetical protein
MSVRRWECTFTAEPHKSRRNRKKRDGVLAMEESGLVLREDGAQIASCAQRSVPSEGDLISLSDCGVEIEVCEELAIGQIPLSDASIDRDNGSSEAIFDDVWAELESSSTRKRTQYPAASHKWFNPQARQVDYPKRSAAISDDQQLSSSGRQHSQTAAASLCVGFDPTQSVALKRLQPISDTFASLKEYKRALLAALDEEIALRIGDIANSIHNALASLALRSPTAEEVRSALHTKRVPNVLYCCNASLESFGSRLFLKIANEDRPGPSKAFGLGDIWATSKCPLLAKQQVVLLRTLSHGFAGDSVEVQALGEAETKSLCSRKLYALHLGSFGTELLMRDSLVSMLQQNCQNSLTLLKAIIHQSSQSAHQSGTPQDVEYAVPKSLNDIQASIFTRLAGFISSSGGSTALLMGAFGSGKTLLAAELIKQWWESGKRNGRRVLVVTNSNAAVDQLCLKLIELGMTDICRVGSEERIDAQIKPYSAKAGADVLSEDIAETRQELKEETDSRKKRKLEDDIRKMQKERNEHKAASKAENASSTFVVATTIASCGNDVLVGSSFDVCVIDEATQTVECAAVMPLLRCHCDRLMMIGDPAQLPPVVAHASSEHQRDMSCSMFERLKDIGHPVHFLNKQMRCHPRISRIANGLFYDGQLDDGIHEVERPPLIQGLPPVSWVDCGGSKEICSSMRSTYNSAEAEAVLGVVAELIAHLNAEDIGVIAFYRAQRDEIQRMLRERGTKHGEDIVQVNTVDAFQGASKQVIVASICGRQSFITSKRVNVAITRARHHMIVVGSDVSAHTAFEKVRDAAKEYCGGYVHNRLNQLNIGKKASREERSGQEK